jgi:hypothetical protein
MWTLSMTQTTSSSKTNTLYFACNFKVLCIRHYENYIFGYNWKNQRVLDASYSGSLLWHKGYILQGFFTISFITMHIYTNLILGTWI